MRLSSPRFFGIFSSFSTFKIEHDEIVHCSELVRQKYFEDVREIPNAEQKDSSRIQ